VLEIGDGVFEVTVHRRGDKTRRLYHFEKGDPRRLARRREFKKAQANRSQRRPDGVAAPLRGPPRRAKLELSRDTGDADQQDPFITADFRPKQSITRLTRAEALREHVRDARPRGIAGPARPIERDCQSEGRQGDRARSCSSADCAHAACQEKSERLTGQDTLTGREPGRGRGGRQTQIRRGVLPTW